MNTHPKFQHAMRAAHIAKVSVKSISDTPEGEVFIQTSNGCHFFECDDTWVEMANKFIG